MGYLIVMKTSGVPIGIGYGFSVFPFMAGAALIELSKQKHS